MPSPLVTVLLLGFFEVTARIIAGPPEIPPLLKVYVPLGHVRLTQQDDVVTAAYQRDGVNTRYTVEPTPGVPRVAFCGGSSVHGGSRLPMELEFPARVQALLERQGVGIEALNMGSPSLDSSSILQLSSTLLQHQLDLLVIYTGHNDLGNTMQEKRYGTVGSALLVRLRLLLWRSRTYCLLRDAMTNTATTAEPPPRRTRRRPGAAAGSGPR